MHKHRWQLEPCLQSRPIGLEDIDGELYTSRHTRNVQGVCTCGATRVFRNTELELA